MDQQTIQGEQAGSQTAYAHLVGAFCDSQAVATCLYFDELRPDVELCELLDLAEHWFTQHGFRPRVMRGTDASKAPLLRPTIRKFRAPDSGRTAIEVINRLEIFPKGRTTVEDNWLPPVYFVASMGRPTGAFMSVNSALDASAALVALKHGDRVLGASASYAFWFPVRCSPLAYFWSMSFQSNRRDDVRWGDRERRRLSNWRDNTDEIGPRWYSTRDGYVRDVYPLMLLGAAHMDRPVGPIPLRRAIEERQLGPVVPVGDRFLWSIPREKLAEAQVLLDDHDICLSARIFDGPGTLPE